LEEKEEEEKEEEEKEEEKEERAGPQCVFNGTIQGASDPVLASPNHWHLS
jgi:hypothetical protein